MLLLLLRPKLLRLLQLAVGEWEGGGGGRGRRGTRSNDLRFKHCWFFFPKNTVLHNVVLLRTRSPAPARSQVNLANAEGANKEEEEEDDDEEEEEEQAPPWTNISASGGVDSGGGKEEFFCTLDGLRIK